MKWVLLWSAVLQMRKLITGMLSNWFKVIPLLGRTRWLNPESILLTRKPYQVTLEPWILLDVKQNCVSQESVSIKPPYLSAGLLLMTTHINTHTRVFHPGQQRWANRRRRDTFLAIGCPRTGLPFFWGMVTAQSRRARVLDRDSRAWKELGPPGTGYRDAAGGGPGSKARMSKATRDKQKPGKRGKFQPPWNWAWGALATTGLGPHEEKDSSAQCCPVLGTMMIQGTLNTSPRKGIWPKGAVSASPPTIKGAGGDHLTHSQMPRF